MQQEAVAVVVRMEQVVLLAVEMVADTKMEQEKQVNMQQLTLAQVAVAVSLGTVVVLEDLE